MKNGASEMVEGGWDIKVAEQKVKYVVRRVR